MSGETSLEVSRGFTYGLRQSLTIVIGYAPVAVTFGILATQFGLTYWEAGLMSFFVYAGASQFIAIEMIHQGATVWMIGLTTLIINIRHLLMSLSVVPYFSERTLTWSLGLAQGLTDETFVLNTTPNGSIVIIHNPFLWAGLLTFLFSRFVPNLFLGISLE